MNTHDDFIGVRLLDRFAEAGGWTPSKDGVQFDHLLARWTMKDGKETSRFETKFSALLQKFKIIRDSKIQRLECDFRLQTDHLLQIFARPFDDFEVVPLRVRFQEHPRMLKSADRFFEE